MQQELEKSESVIPGKLFANALCDTVATMAGIGLNQVDDSLKHENPFLCDSISGMMILPGDKAAVILISANRFSAAEIVTYMTGIDSSELTENDLVDGVLEIVNMTAGTARAQLVDSPYAFRLTSPFALKSDGAEIITKRSINGYTAKFSADNIQLVLKIFYF